jgi:hypothetical protein
MGKKTERVAAIAAEASSVTDAAPHTNVVSLVIGTIFPLATMLFFVFYALRPEWFDDDQKKVLALVLFAEFPGMFLGAIFVGVMQGGGSRKFQTALYITAVAIFAAGFWQLTIDAVIGPALAWAALSQIATIAFSPIDPLSVARVNAAYEDVGRLIVIVPIFSIVLIIAALAVGSMSRDADGLPWFEPEVHHLGWIGATYFLVRAASIAHAQTATFARTRKSLLDGTWVDRFIAMLPSRARDDG